MSTSLSGQNKTGELKLDIADTTVQITHLALHSAASAGNNFPSDSLNRTGLAAGQFGNVIATWDTTSATVPVAFYSLGPTFLTQYNTPYANDSTCSANLQNAIIIYQIDSVCHYDLGQKLGSAFMSQVRLNGTGVIGNSQVVKAYNAGARNICPLWLPHTDPTTLFSVDTGGNPILKITGTHNSVLSDATGAGSELNNGNPRAGSVAVMPDPNAATQPASPLSFGDQILLVDQNDVNDSLGPRSVQDICPVCNNSPGSAHIDVYNSSKVCHGVPSFGSRTVIRLR